MDEKEAQDVMTVKETAEYLRTTPWHVYRLVDSGDLPCARLGRSIRISKKVVDLMLDGCVVEDET